MSASYPDLPASAGPRLTDILPLNTVELMTLINFHHLDEKALLDGGKVLKQKSGYTHLFTQELVDILAELDLNPPPALMPAYGPHYRRVHAFNGTLLSTVFPAPPAAEDLAAFKLLAPYLFKYYSPMVGYDALLLRLQPAVRERWDAGRVRAECSTLDREIDALLSFEKTVDGPFPRNLLERFGFAARRTVRLRYEFYGRLSAALTWLGQRFDDVLRLDDRVRAFAREHEPLLAALIRSFQGLGVKVESIDSPNHDYLRFYERYNGPLDMTVPPPEGIH